MANDKDISRRWFLQSATMVTAAGIWLPRNLEANGPLQANANTSKNSSTESSKSTIDKRPVDHVNVLFGTAALDDPALIGNAPPPGEEMYTGMVSPGAALPHGVDAGPINKDISLAYPHGNLYSYVYARRTMVGFSSMVTDSLLMPVVGDWTTPPDRIRYASVYDKSSERSTPGYYTVHLPDHEITVEITATSFTALYRFTFAKTDRAAILFDLGPAATPTLEIVGDRTVRGCTEEGKSYFVAEFSKSFKSFGTFYRRPYQPDMVGFGWFLLGMDTLEYASRTATGSFAGCYLNYTMAHDEAVLVRMAAGSSFEQAHQRLRAENPEFENTKQTAIEVWNKKLNAIEVMGGTERTRDLFYSAFYHAFASPTKIAKNGEQYRSKDGKLRLAEYDRYDEVPYWDTGRNQVVLLTLLDPETKKNILRSQLDMARESGWMGTSFHGDHAVAMYLGDWERGLPFDYEAAYSYLRKNAMDSQGPRANLDEYLEKGWIHDVVVDNPSPPYDRGNAGVSKTLEYCYDDYCLALFAKKLGKEDDHQIFLKRAGNYKNAWDPTSRFMRGRQEDGSWIAPFYADEPYYNFMYKEANAWQMQWFVPHDIHGLMALMGGREAFVQRLDEFFNIAYTPKGIARDVTGLIGQYCHGNEPDHHVPYLYNWSGTPWKTQAIVRRIMKVMYGSDRQRLGLAGMDDNGENCSWFVLSALGFYTVDPARAEYIIGSPLFEEATIHLGSGRDFTIVAKENSEDNVYVQSATLNGKDLNQPWFHHYEIANGGRLILRMGATPNKKWGSDPTAAPPSMSRHGSYQITADRNSMAAFSPMARKLEPGPW